MNTPTIDSYINVLKGLTIQSPVKIKTYRHVQQALDNGSQLTIDQIKVLLSLFKDDLLIDIKCAPVILVVLNKILVKLKEGDYSSVPELTDSAKSIYSLLTMLAPLQQVQNLQCTCMEVLLNYPETMLLEVNLAHPDCTYKLVDRYLGISSIDMQLKTSVLTLLLKVLDLTPASKKYDFVNSGISIWFSRVIPMMFTPGNGHREVALQIMEKMLPELSTMQYEDNLQWIAIYRNINEANGYPQIIDKMLKSGDPLWPRMWCCVVKLLGAQLHKNGGPINFLLHVMENAFKMDNATRCEAFRCWKVLIENFSSRPKDVLLHNVKRVKLLSIPLALNNAKTEEIAILKFDIWWYFLAIFQEDIIKNAELVLIPFLNFCFGEPKKLSSSSPGKQVVPGLVFPLVQKASIKCLVEMLGHEGCNGCVGADFGKLKKKIVDQKLFEFATENWINAVQQGFVLISENILKSDDVGAAILLQNAKCIWMSFLKITVNIDNAVKSSEVLKRIFKMMDFWVEKCKGNSCLASMMISLIIPTFADTSVGYSWTALNQTDSDKNNQTHLQTLFLILLSSKLYKKERMALKCSPYKQLVESGLKAEPNGFCGWILQTINGKKHNLQVWCCLAESLSTGNYNINNDIYKAVLLWLITNNIETEKFLNITETWKTLFLFLKTKHSNNDNSNSYDDDILDQLLKTADDISHISSNLTCLFFLNIILEQRSHDYAGDFKWLVQLIAALRKVLKQSKKTSEADLYLKGFCNLLETVTAVLIKYLEHCNDVAPHSQPLVSLIEESGESIVSLINQKNFSPISQSSILELLKYSQNILQPSRFTHLGRIFVNIFQALLKSYDSLEYKEDCILLYKHISKLNNKTKIIGKTEILEIQQQLGIENTSAINSPANTSSKNKSEDEFLVIKPTWKFNPKNLTEHQKEVMKRRKEDIPALYEDLSQSQDEYTLKGWKPPGYVSDGLTESSKSQETSENVNPKRSNILNGDKKNNLKRNLKQVPEMCPFIMKEFNVSTAVTPDTKKSSDSKNLKSNAENIEVQSPLTTPKRNNKNNSVRSRIDKNLKKLQEQSALDTSQKLNESFGNLENISAETTDIEINNKCTLSNKSVITTDKSIDRPSRIKKKPNKFDPDDTSFITRRRASTSVLDVHTNLSQTPVSVDDNLIQTKNSDETSHDTPPKIKQRKSRLLSQLFIDMVEGHPSELIKENGLKNSRKRKSDVLEPKVRPNEPYKKRPYTKRKFSSEESSHSPKEALKTMEDIIHSTKSLIHAPLIFQDVENVNTSLKDTTIKDISATGVANENMETDCSTVEHDNNYHLPISPALPESEDIIESSQGSSTSTVSIRTPRRIHAVISNEKSKIKSVDSSNSVCDIVPIEDTDVGDSTNIEQIATVTLQDIQYTSENHYSAAIVQDENISKKNHKQPIAKMTTQQIAEADTEPESHILEKLAEYTEVSVNNETDCEQKPSDEKEDKTLHQTEQKTSNKIILDLPDDPPIDEICVIDISDDGDNPTLSTSIVSSLSQEDLENKNTELLNSTIHLSPIKSITSLTDNIEEFVTKEGGSSTAPDSNSIEVPETPSTEKYTSLNSNSPEIFCSEKISPEKEIQKEKDSPPRSASLLSSPSTVAQKKSRTSLNRVSGRAAQMLGLCKVDPDSIDRCNIIQEKYMDGAKEPSPSVTPVRRSLHNLYVNPEGIEVIENPESYVEKPILEFNRTLPSPYASPVGPILKRSHDDSIGSPTSKRKRVSFHDPPVSTTISIKNYIEPPQMIRSPQQTYVRNVRESKKPLVVKCLIKNMETEAITESKKPSTPQTTTTIEKNTNGIDNDLIINIDSQMSEVCSLAVESPEVMEITNNCLLDDILPIYPSLRNSIVSISEIASELSSPMWKDNFLKDIEINTIGELAAMTELQVNRLPVKSPKIKTVRKVLSDYEARTKHISVDVDIEQIPLEDVRSLQATESRKIVFESKDIQTESTEHKCVYTQSDFDHSFGDIMLNYNTNMVSKENMDSDISTSLANPAVSEVFSMAIKNFAQSSPTEFGKIISNTFSQSLICEHLSVTALTQSLLKQVEECDNARQVVKDNFKHILEDQEQIRIEKQSIEIIGKVRMLLGELSELKKY